MSELLTLSRVNQDVFDILTDQSLNHQQATDELNSYFSVLDPENQTSRTSVRRARDKLGVVSPATTGPVYSAAEHDRWFPFESEKEYKKSVEAYAEAFDRAFSEKPTTRKTAASIVEKSRGVNERLHRMSDTSNYDVSPGPLPVTYGPWEPGKPATAVFLGDWQVGAHNPQLIEASIDLIRDLQPDVIGHTGDESDQTVLGRWVRGTEEEYGGDLQEEFDITSEYLEAIADAAPNAELHLAASNHGMRLEKAIADRLPGLGSLRCLKLEKLLGLDELGWEYHPEQYEILPGLLLFHGHAEGFSSGTPLKRIEDFMLRKGKSFIFGHTHRFGLHTTAQGFNFNMDTLFAANPGHMMNLSSAEYIHHKSPNWSSGLVVVHYDGERLYPETVLAKDNVLYYNGKKYQ